MLYLKRNRRFNELIKCQISNEYIYPGDYYYEDDTDGLIVKATVYKDMKNREKFNKINYEKINNAQSENNYRQMLNDYTKQILSDSLLYRKVAGKYDPNTEEDLEIRRIYEDNIAGEIK